MRARGFTLVEVMVALAIVAIALPAVLMSLYRQIDDTAYLRDKTMAQMVAANKLAEMRLVIASTRVLNAGKDNGVAQMADREWHWWVETKPTEQVPKFFRIEIRVGLSEEEEVQPLYALTAFMSSDLKIDKTGSGVPNDPNNPDDPNSPIDPNKANDLNEQIDPTDPSNLGEAPPAGPGTDPSGIGSIPGLDLPIDLPPGVSLDGQ